MNKQLRRLGAGLLGCYLALFAMVIFVVWAGTVAQKESGVWVAIGQYFRTWFAFVDFKVFAFFLPKPPDWSGGYTSLFALQQEEQWDEVQLETVQQQHEQMKGATRPAPAATA